MVEIRCCGTWGTKKGEEERGKTTKGDLGRCISDDLWERVNDYGARADIAGLQIGWILSGPAPSRHFSKAHGRVM